MLHIFENNGSNLMKTTMWLYLEWISLIISAALLLFPECMMGKQRWATEVRFLWNMLD